MMNRWEKAKQQLDKLATTQCSGAAMSFYDAAWAESLAKRFDFVIVDSESFDMSSQLRDQMISAIENGGAMPIIKMGNQIDRSLRDSVNSGAVCVQLPMVRGAKDVASAEQEVFFPPLGKRTHCPMARSNAYMLDSIMAVMTGTNESFSLCPIFETVEALENIDEILERDSVRTCEIGPVDLLLALGINPDGDWWKIPELQRAVDKIIAGCEKNNVTVMLPVMARRGVDLEDAVKKLRGQGIHHVWIPDGSLVEWGAMAMNGSGIER